MKPSAPLGSSAGKDSPLASGRTLSSGGDGAPPVERVGVMPEPDSLKRIMDITASSQASPTRLLSTRTSAPGSEGPKPSALPAELAPYLPKLLRDEFRMVSAGGSVPATKSHTLPRTSTYNGAVMIIDISGFTALGERLRAELGPEEGKRRGGVLSCVLWRGCVCCVPGRGRGHGLRCALSAVVHPFGAVSMVCVLRSFSGP